MSGPLALFRDWMARAEREGQPVPEACCLSTVGLDGYPNARVVAMMDYDAAGFVVAGPAGSRKWLELKRVARAALTFWWPTIGRQVRIQGDALPLMAQEADGNFASCHRDAQVVSWVSRQGQPLTEAGVVDRTDLEAVRAEFSPGPVPRPKGWGGYRIIPRRVEFFRFRADRWHDRLEFHEVANAWQWQRLQP